ncbi:MAG TPA: AAA family ATPase, partial [Inquilinus sp.]|nr:AAA family ATPase [Inquilinus sp.]
MPEQAPLSGPAPSPSGRPARIALTRLTLTEFRCYGQLRIELDPRPVVLTGPNGAGKTNLLEAVSFLSPGRGLRRAPLPEVTRRQAAEGKGWAVAAQL